MGPTRRPTCPAGSAFDDVLALVLDAAHRAPAPGLPRRLDALLRDLARPEPSRPADDLEDLIWALWISHPDAKVEDEMMAAVEAMGAGDLARAGPILDRLVADHPDWAEAWNKRATLAFIQKRDPESLADIGRALTLEPRHFGAIAGFGQICLRHGRLAEARAAFQIALAVNPHLRGVRGLIEELTPERAMLH